MSAGDRATRIARLFLMTKKQSKRFATKAKKLLKAREVGRSNYACADRLLGEMRAEGLRPGDEIVINSAGDRAVLKDLYANVDKVFRSHGIGRYELELVRAS
jgi:hypothetical protein